jgi:hypothetical protein
MNEIKFTQFKEWDYNPLTIGLWRPYQVEVGFVEDYIKRSGYENNLTILFMYLTNKGGKREVTSKG